MFKDSYQVNLAGAMAILLWTTCQVIVFDIPTLLAQLKPMVDLLMDQETRSSKILEYTTTFSGRGHRWPS